MHLIQTDDFETVKSKYIDVIENTPDIGKYARWIYGKHPTDELLKAYINREEMYVRGKMILPSHGKEFFTSYGKHFFT